MRPKISAVVCCKNEAARIVDCLRALRQARPDEIVLVDGASTDETVELARPYVDKIIVSTAKSLTADRQIGIDAAREDVIAMIDADHRVKPGDLDALYQDMVEYDFDVVQSGIRIEPASFWCRAENDAFEIFHRTPGPRAMIGTAPALYRRRVFEAVRFDAHITRMKDDADFIYRLSQCPDYAYGVGRTVIDQAHFGGFSDYVQKFAWYGRGDAEFCRKHPNRAASMAFHLLVRYPLFRSAKALVKGKPRAVPYFILCGLTRAASMFGALLKSSRAAEPQLQEA